MLALDDLLLARDFSSISDRAFRHALDLAARTGAALHLLHVEVLHEDDERESPTVGLEKIREDLKSDPRAASADALDAVSIHEVTERDVSPGPAILNYAATNDIDLITLGTHGRRGPKRILLGSVAEEVVRRAKVPVLTVRGGEDATTLEVGGVDRVLVPIDFSDPSREALRHARALASLYGAEIDLLYVVEEALHPAFYVGGVSSIYDVEPDIEEKARTHLQKFADKTSGADVNINVHAVPGRAAASILSFVEEYDIDLVTTSTHGRTGMDRFLLGSVAEKLVRHLRCPVLTVKAFGRSIVSDAE
jgi:nucleotide-binding universal stress UspA family protein